LKKKSAPFQKVSRAGSGSYLRMLFLKGLDCPTQYFDCANSGAGGEVGRCWSEAWTPYLLHREPGPPRSFQL